MKKVSRTPYTPEYYDRYMKGRAKNFVINRPYEAAGLSISTIEEAANKMGSNPNEFINAALLYAVRNPQMIKKVLEKME